MKWRGRWYFIKSWKKIFLTYSVLEKSAYHLIVTISVEPPTYLSGQLLHFLRTRLFFFQGAMGNSGSWDSFVYLVAFRRAAFEWREKYLQQNRRPILEPVLKPRFVGLCFLHLLINLYAFLLYLYVILIKFFYALTYIYLNVYIFFSPDRLSIKTKFLTRDTHYLIQFLTSQPFFGPRHSFTITTITVQFSIIPILFFHQY